MLFGILFMMEALGELILFAACLFSFAAGLISLLFFLMGLSVLPLILFRLVPRLVFESLF